LLRRRISLFLICICLFTVTVPALIAAVEEPSERSEEIEYIVKWIHSPLAPGDEYEILSHDMELQITLIKVANHSAPELLRRLREDPNIQYVEPNFTLSVGARSVQQEGMNQYYLDQTRIREAWELVAPNPDLTVAVLDTGVDLTHPDLVDNLVEGFNLIDPKKPPQDDHGHGTMIAGVLGASGKNPNGITGILKQVRIMPIKVMRNDGKGGSADVAKGIRLAVDEGADIVLLSLGDWNYSSLIQEVVNYAESKRVLVVSATGNNMDFVNYPAALPTVLGVGAVDTLDRVETYSNKGQEVDVVAPGSVIYTTVLGGGYDTRSGTSLAAPQVAGLAGLILSKYPDFTPAQVRNLIRYSAVDIESPGWDKKSGYGRIDAVRALTMTLPKDIYEPNESSAQAKVAPLGKMVDATLSSTQDKDWYKVEVPYDGTLRLQFTNIPVNNSAVIKTTLYTSQLEQVKSVSHSKNTSIVADVKKGVYFIKLEVTLGSVESSAGLPYSLTTRFNIYHDAYMSNNTQEKAAKIPLDSKPITATFSQDHDEDWFEFAIPLEGKFSFTLTPDSLRIDPVVTVITPDGKKLIFDDGNILSESLKYNLEKGTIEVTEGKLKIGVRNFYNIAANAEYTLEWKYTPDIIDKYEPNNSIFDAKLVKLGEPIYGYIASIADYDYFKITIAEDGLYQIAGNNFPQKVRPSMNLYDQKYNRIATVNVDSNATSFAYKKWLTKGTYFIRIDAKSKFTHQLYRLMIQKLDAAFKDIIGNWAQDSINHLTGLGIVNGYEDKTFQPNRAITRGEFVHLLVKSLAIPKGTTVTPFKDVKSNYWAYSSIQAAYQRGIITGYEDGNFRPEAPISRAEMVAILARGLDYKPVNGSEKVKPASYLAIQRFADIYARAWYTDDLSILLQLKLIKGFDDDTFRPLAKASRAEVVTMLERIWFSN